MKKIKVAFFAEILIEDFDGASRTMFQIIKRIPREEFEFLFICGIGPAKIFDFDCVTVPSVSLPFNKNYTMALPYLAETELKRKLDNFCPDIVHIATPAFLGHFGLQYAKNQNLPVLTIYHTHFIAYLDYYLSKAPFLIDIAKAKLCLAQKSFYNQCDVIYVPSESIEEEMYQMGIEPARMKIWKRGIDTSLFSPDKKTTGFARSLTQNDHPIILFASRLVWEKNLETLIRIYDYCQENEIPYNFIIAGDGTAKIDCQRRMQNAIFTGTLDHLQLSQLYASSDIFLFTSISETYGNVVLEAMASGLPCVIADGGGSADLVTQGVNGFKCHPENEGDYVEKMQILINDPMLRQQFSKRGRNYSLCLDWNRLTNLYFTEIHNLSGVLNV
ncbi:glycosyltransferase family 1 protein [Dyadobacter sp. CY356]|uniref:glycosyltransferase family 4 protein n=1 Tax=Dyadobacter sp. CY356 TaxID=2906442 RepID=UPI001F161687|nr:glycosyltransferase family 1 protein [Dyadobacter sp. CY356]MCF0054512.1 glycosyltransferase family 1 protein [Dyadobacter sp. CY356]